MSPDRAPYSEGGPTAEEALAQMGTYNSYFGRFSVNEDEGYVTHHLEGSLDPSGAGSDYQRFFTFSDDGNTLTLQPPPDENGVRSFITWAKLPDLAEAELTETHRRLFGFYRIESITRETTEASRSRRQTDGVNPSTRGGHMACTSCGAAACRRRRRADADEALRRC